MPPEWCELRAMHHTSAQDVRVHGCLLSLCEYFCLVASMGLVLSERTGPLPLRQQAL